MTRELMDFQDIRYYQVFIKGDFSGKMCNLVMVHCRDGQLSYDEPIRFQEKDSTIRLTYFAQSIDSDTAKISLKSKAVHSTRKYDVKNCKSHILMETYTEAPLTTADTIPVIAYTTGLVQNFMFEGKPVTGIDYCGLRFAKVNPKEWSEKYGVKDFVYYIIYFENVNKNIKIKKLVSLRQLFLRKTIDKIIKLLYYICSWQELTSER